MAENKVLAVVEGKEITEDIVLKFMNDLGPQMAMQLQNPEGMKRVVEELVNQELLYLEAKETGVDKDQEFLNELKRLEEGLLKQYVVSKLLVDVDIDEEEIKKYYDENQEMFKKPEMVQASHILVADLEEANKIYEEIKAGKDFAEAASEKSTCPSKEQGGNLGEFGRGQMVKEFEDVAFIMEVGQISEPVETQFGYHIIKLEGKNPESVLDFEEVKEGLSQQLLGMKQQEKYVEKTDKLKEKYKVENKM